jgi:hypothetical protein
MGISNLVQLLTIFAAICTVTVEKCLDGYLSMNIPVQLFFDKKRYQQTPMISFPKAVHRGPVAVRLGSPLNTRENEGVNGFPSPSLNCNVAARLQ